MTDDELFLTDQDIQLNELRAEVERLRAQLAIQYGMHPGGDLAKAAQAEIADLKSANALLHGLISNRDADIERQTERADRAQAHWEEYRAEVERLQADLQTILGEEDVELIWTIARAALEQP